MGVLRGNKILEKKSARKVSGSVSFHPFVERTRKSIDKTAQDKGCFICRRNGLNIRVSPASLDRALRIMDALIKALESKGIEACLEKDGYNYKTYAKISDKKFEFDLYEKISIVKKGADKYGYAQYDYIPNGILVLRIKNFYAVRTEWKDRKKKKVEDQIDGFVEGLHKALEKEREWALKRQIQYDEHLKQEEQQRLLEEEQQRASLLEKEALSWHKSQIIRSYIEVATKIHIQKNGAMIPGSDFDQWRSWAIQQADRLDPLLGHGVSTITAGRG